MDVKINYAKEGTDDRHKSSGVYIYFKDATIFHGQYIKPMIIGDRMYFDESTEFKGKGNYIKLSKASGNSNDTTVARRIKKVSKDLDYIRLFVPFIGEHKLRFDSRKKRYFVNSLNKSDNNLPDFMLPKRKYVHKHKEKSLSDSITEALVKAGMEDRISNRSKITNLKEESKSDIESKIIDLSTKELLDLIYKTVYSAQLHAFTNMKIPIKLQYEKLMEDVENISETYIFNHDIYVRKDEVLEIIENLRGKI